MYFVQNCYLLQPKNRLLLLLSLCCVGHCLSFSPRNTDAGFIITQKLPNSDLGQFLGLGPGKIRNTSGSVCHSNKTDLFYRQSCIANSSLCWWYYSGLYLLLSAHTKTSQCANMHGKLRSCIISIKLNSDESFFFHSTPDDSAILATSLLELPLEVPPPGYIFDTQHFPTIVASHSK